MMGHGCKCSEWVMLSFYVALGETHVVVRLEEAPRTGEGLQVVEMG